MQKRKINQGKSVRGRVQGRDCYYFRYGVLGNPLLGDHIYTEPLKTAWPFRGKTFQGSAR